MAHIVRKLAPSSQHFKQLGQYARSPGHMGYCYAELAVFNLKCSYQNCMHGQKTCQSKADVFSVSSDSWWNLFVVMWT